MSQSSKTILNRVFSKKKVTALFYIIFLITISACNDQNQNSAWAETTIDSNPLFTPKQLLQERKLETVYHHSETVRCGILAQNGDLWFGTSNEGLYKFDGNSFTQYTVKDGLSDNNVISILEDKEGILWLGTGDGICRYDHKSFTSIPIPNANKNIWGEGMGSNHVLCIMQDKSGFIWFGTWGGGAFRFDPSKPLTSEGNYINFLADRGRIQKDGLHHNVIQSIIEDTDGNIWLTSMTHDGISKYDGKNFTHFMPEDGLSYDQVTCSYQDRVGNIWFGSLGNENGSLDRFDGNNFTNFNEQDGLCSNNTIAIHEDQAGNLWLGSSRGELCIYDGKTFSPFTTKDGQTFERTGFIMEDSNGNVWFGGNYGHLFRYNPSETIKTGEIVVVDFTQKGSV